MANQTSFKNIPAGTKLIVLGDLYRKPYEGWNIVGYFRLPNHLTRRIPFPVDALMALSPGRTYPIEDSLLEPTGYKDKFILPSVNEWELSTFQELPESLKRMEEYGEQVVQQKVFRIKTSQYICWLPTIELAKKLYCYSAELVRVAMLEGNLNMVGRAYIKEENGYVDLTSSIPVSYLKRKAYRQYLAWLMFSDGVAESFCSIYEHKNKKTNTPEKYHRWTFNFKPPELKGVEISWCGYTSDDRKHIFVREITALAGLKAPELNAVHFTHPNDTVVDSKSRKQGNGGGRYKPEPTNHIIDTNYDPKSGNKHRMVDIPKTGFYFDRELNTYRKPVSGRAGGKGIPESVCEGDNIEDVGITESDRNGKNPRADFNALDDKKEAKYKFDEFWQVLDIISANNPDWDINFEVGHVPKGKSRKLYKIGARKRYYLHAHIQKSPDTVVHILEIELSDDRNLSTLMFRVKSKLSESEVINKVLLGLMNNCCSWDRATIEELTITRAYLDHPRDGSLSEQDRDKDWARRAIEKLNII